MITEIPVDDGGRHFEVRLRGGEVVRLSVHRHTDEALPDARPGTHEWHAAGVDWRALQEAGIALSAATLPGGILHLSGDPRGITSNREQPTEGASNV